MDKTIKDVLDDHLSLCVLAYARLTDRHDGQDLMRNRQDGVMGLAIQAASLFTVASMNALGDSRRTARVLEVVKGMFLELEDVSSVGETCLSSLGLLEDALSPTGNIPRDGVITENDEPPLGTAGAGITPSRQKRRRIPPSP